MRAEAIEKIIEDDRRITSVDLKVVLKAFNERAVETCNDTGGASAAELTSLLRDCIAEVTDR
eukprot:8971773-Pyramimonas_sp.AAC.1